MLQDGDELVTRQPGVEEGRALMFGEAVRAGKADTPGPLSSSVRALMFGEAVRAGAAVEQAALLAGAVAGADGQVALATLAGQGTVGVPAAEAAEVVHARSGGLFGLQVIL